MTPCEKYKVLLEVLMAFKDADEKMLESPESDIIRNMMDPLWYGLTGEEMDAIEKWNQERSSKNG